MPTRFQPSQAKLFKRSGSPKWQVVFRVGDPKTGKRLKIVKSTYEEDREKAIEIKDRIVKDVLEELYTEQARASSRQPIEDFIEEYYRIRLHSSSTERDYRSVTNQFVEHFGSSSPLSVLTRINCQEWVNLANTPHQRDKRYRVMHALLEEAIKDDKLTANPISFRRPTVPQNNRDIFDSDSELVRFYEQMADDTYRHRVIKFMTGFMSGAPIRDGDLAFLEATDFDWVQSVFWIRNKQAHHTKNWREFSLPITARVEEIYRLQMQNKMREANELIRESSYLFPNSKGRPFVDTDGTPRPIARLFREQRNCILPNRKGLHPHSIRHSVAQHAYNHAVSLREIMTMLNHSGEGITEKFYARPRDLRRAEKRYATFEEYLGSLPLLSRVMVIHDVEEAIPETSN